MKTLKHYSMPTQDFPKKWLTGVLVLIEAFHGLCWWRTLVLVVLMCWCCLKSSSIVHTLILLSRLFKFILVDVGSRPNAGTGSDEPFRSALYYLLFFIICTVYTSTLIHSKDKYTSFPSIYVPWKISFKWNTVIYSETL